MLWALSKGQAEVCRDDSYFRIFWAQLYLSVARSKKDQIYFSPLHIYFTWLLILSTTTADYPTLSHMLWSWQIHHKIKPNSSKQVILIETSSNLIGKKSVDLSSLPDKGKVAVGIDKNSILSDYEEFCLLKGITTQVSSSIKAGEL